MRTDFKFSNLLGTVYRKGNLLFTPDGDGLLSPVGNRVATFDLVRNISRTLPFSHRRNITQLALNTLGNLLLSVDEDGRAILINYPSGPVLHTLSFRGPVTALSFSPSGHHFVVGIGNLVEVWRTPSNPTISSDDEVNFAPFHRHRVYAGHSDTIQSLEWSSDSRFFLSSAADLTARIWSLNAETDFEPTTLAGHRAALLGAWFSADQEEIYTVSRDGALYRWHHASPPADEDSTGSSTDEARPSRWRVMQRHFFQQANTKTMCAAYHSSSNLLVAGFSNGLFGLYELPQFNLIHTMSISQHDINSVSINKSGEWFAFGAAKLGQLLVWEWQSESYVLKQQGHFDAINALTYSPEGQRIISASDDGKIKVWDTKSGFCNVTFTEHSSGVTACEFARRGNVLFTASLDGSVRAWDLIRYRNFRTFTAPSRLSFTCVTVDPSGEVVCAGSSNSFDIHIWSVQTGQLLDQLSGHQGPVSSLAFTPSGSTLVSGSWDHTVRLWDIFNRAQTNEPLQLQAEVLDIAIRPDAKEVAVSSLDGQLTFWSLTEAIQSHGLNGRRDVTGGRNISDRRTAARSAGSKNFSSISYSMDGSCVVAGGNSKYICLYDVQSGSLLKKFTVSVNLSLQGTQEYLNSRSLTEGGPIELIDDDEEEAPDHQHRAERTLPGVHRGDYSSRTFMPQIRVTALAFSPDGQGFCAASTEGLLLYSLNEAVQFDPFNLEIDITPENTIAAVAEAQYLRALVMAFRLNERALLDRVYSALPVDAIGLVIAQLPSAYLSVLMRFLAQAADGTPHVERSLRWIEALLSRHGPFLKSRAAAFSTEMMALRKAVARIQARLSRLNDDNVYILDYLLS